MLEEIIETERKNAQRMKKINDRRKKIMDANEASEAIRLKGRITSSKLAAQGHFQLDKTVRDAVKQRIAEVEQEEKKKQEKRLQNELKQKQKYEAAKQKEMDATKTLTLADKRQICRYERLPTDPTTIMSMSAAEVISFYDIILKRRIQSAAVAAV